MMNTGLYSTPDSGHIAPWFAWTTSQSLTSTHYRCQPDPQSRHDCKKSRHDLWRPKPIFQLSSHTRLQLIKLRFSTNLYHQILSQF